MIIEIIKIPAGVEPEFVRKEWKGLWLEAHQGIEDIKDGGFVIGVYVDAPQALSILEKKSLKAAEWYSSNIPEEKLNSFSFGPFTLDEFREV